MPEENVRTALARFYDSQVENLPVLDVDRDIIGYLTEAYALRRYNQELDARDMPSDWPVGVVPYDRSTPYEQPAPPMHSDTSP